MIRIALIVLLLVPAAFSSVLSRQPGALAAQAQVAPSQGEIPAPEAGLPPGQQLKRDLPEFRSPQGGSNTKEIPLPEVFRGCWSGTVPQVDSMVRLSPSTEPIGWLTKSYKLCYKQIGYGGKWQLTFAQGGVAERWRVSDERQSIEVKSVSRDNRAELGAYLHFRAPRIDAFTGLPSGIIDAVDELTHLSCHVLPGNDVLAVHAEVYVEQDRHPFISITWHATFWRSGERND
jgi:hypothetical protein